MPSELYFIAIIPPEPIWSEVKRMKEEIRDTYGPKHALKSPAHITLQMPFRCHPGRERELTQSLDEFCASRKPCSIKLDGFDHFDDRVIFIRIADHESINHLYHDLKPWLTKSFHIDRNNVKDSIHPHMTIATRDLKPDVFQAAWPTYATRAYQSDFELDALCLLKHNGRDWDVLHQAPFRANV